MRRLIINADDLGLTPGVNRAVLEGYRAGVVTSTTLMANARAFEDAVATVAKSPRLSVGCHITLLDAVPLLPATEVKTLAFGTEARFRNSFLDIANATVWGHVSATEIEAEAAAQMRKVQEAGVRLSHFDTHKHAHLLPAVLKPLLRAAKACGVRALRNPFAPVKPLGYAHLMRRPKLWTRYSEIKVLRGMAERFREIVDDAGMITTDGSFGVLTTGALDAKLFRAIVAGVPEGTWEYVCHPGYNDADLAHVSTRLRASRQRELEVLTSETASEVLRENGIQLISYWDLQAQPAGARAKKKAERV
jgi:predicted glycoside hydrolase/deacetylase ChbG (UPF0249 family)